MGLCLSNQKTGNQGNKVSYVFLWNAWVEKRTARRRTTRSNSALVDWDGREAERGGGVEGVEGRDLISSMKRGGVCGESSSFIFPDEEEAEELFLR